MSLSAATPPNHPLPFFASLRVSIMFWFLLTHLFGRSATPRYRRMSKCFDDASRCGKPSFEKTVCLPCLSPHDREDFHKYSHDIFTRRRLGSASTATSGRPGGSNASFPISTSSMYADEKPLPTRITAAVDRHIYPLHCPTRPDLHGRQGKPVGRGGELRKPSLPRSPPGAGWGAVGTRPVRKVSRTCCVCVHERVLHAVHCCGLSRSAICTPTFSAYYVHEILHPGRAWT